MRIVVHPTCIIRPASALRKRKINHQDTKNTKIMKYRKKPVVIEANQACQLTSDGRVIYADGTQEQFEMDHEGTFIRTLEGRHNITEGDFIITGVKGERYPCKPDIFAMTYEDANALPSFEIPFDEDVQNILGRVCFRVAAVARRLHTLGIYNVKTHAEEEQAAALHWMLNLYLKHGKAWGDEGDKILKGAPSPERVTEEIKNP
jgi:hypothetical protein